MKQLMMLAMVFVLTATVFAGCRSQESESSTTTKPTQSTSSTAPSTQSTAPTTQSTAPSTQSTAPSSSGNSPTDGTGSTGAGKLMPRGPRMPHY